MDLTFVVAFEHVAAKEKPILWLMVPPAIVIAIFGVAIALMACKGILRRQVCKGSSTSDNIFLHSELLQLSLQYICVVNSDQMLMTCYRSWKFSTSRQDSRSSCTGNRLLIRLFAILRYSALPKHPVDGYLQQHGWRAKRTTSRVFHTLRWWSQVWSWFIMLNSTTKAWIQYCIRTSRCRVRLQRNIRLLVVWLYDHSHWSHDAWSQGWICLYFEPDWYVSVMHNYVYCYIIYKHYSSQPRKIVQQEPRLHHT